MAFSTDYSDISDGGELIPEGEYEVVIKYAGENATKGGTMFLNVTTVIRNDVDQKYKNKYLWHSIWQKKEPSPSDLACNGYSAKQIQSLSKAAGLPNGKKYESLESWCEDLKYKPIRVTVEHDTYQGNTRAKVKWVNASKHPDCKHVWKSKTDDVPAASVGDNGDFVEISGDDDLPF